MLFKISRFMFTKAFLQYSTVVFLLLAAEAVKISAFGSSKRDLSEHGVVVGDISAALNSHKITTQLQNTQEQTQLQSENDSTVNNDDLKEALKSICLSRKLGNILNPSNGVFIDHGVSAEDILAEMKNEIQKSRGAELTREFGQMLENLDIDPYFITKNKILIGPVLAFVVGILIFIFWLLFLLPILCFPSSCRWCCFCIRQKAHNKESHRWWNLFLGTGLGVIILVLAIIGYRADSKFLSETTAALCAGGHLVNELTYGAPSASPGHEEAKQPSFLGFANIGQKASSLVAAADGNENNNILTQVKQEIEGLADTTDDRAKLKAAITAASSNMNSAKAVTEPNSQTNIFLQKNFDTLSKLYNSITTNLDTLDISNDVEEALYKIRMPPVDTQVFFSMDDMIDIVVEMASFLSDGLLESQDTIESLDAMFLSLSCIAAVFGILTLLLLFWQMFRPNKCLLRMLGAMALLMTLLAVLFCIAVTLMLFIRRSATPICDYVTTDFLNVDSSHIYAKWYGEDSVQFQVTTTCLSATGSGDLFEQVGGTSEVDTILGTLEQKEKELCNGLPQPPKCDFLDLKDFGEKATQQSWAVTLKDSSKTDTFPQIIDSGIQKPDSLLFVDGATKTIFGMVTVSSVMTPWKVVVSKSSNPGNLTVTSQAPTDSDLKKWLDECKGNPNNQNCDRLAAGVSLLKQKIAMLTMTPNCYSSSNLTGTTCTITDLMGGVGGSNGPQNALDRSIVETVNQTNHLKSRVQNFNTMACDKARHRIEGVKKDVLTVKQGTNCRFLRERMIRLTNHLCFGATSGLDSGWVEHLLLAIALVLFSVLLLVYIVHSRDNSIYDTLDTAEKENPAELVGVSKEPKVDGGMDGSHTQDEEREVGLETTAVEE